MCLNFTFDDTDLLADEFAELLFTKWPRLQSKLNRRDIEQALSKTINVTARHNSKVVGCLRVLTDGCLMSVVCEVVVRPECRNMGVQGRLLALVSEKYPRSLLFAVHRATEESMKPYEWKPGYSSFVLIKEK
jgi:hypothetical protein